MQRLLFVMNITNTDETDDTFTFCPSREFLQLYMTFVEPLLQVLPYSLELFDQMCSFRPACFEILGGSTYAIYNIMNGNCYHQIKSHDKFLSFKSNPIYSLCFPYYDCTLAVSTNNSILLYSF